MTPPRAWAHPVVISEHALIRWRQRWRPLLSPAAARASLIALLPGAQFERVETGNAEPQAFWSLPAGDDERAFLTVDHHGVIKTVHPRGMTLAPARGGA